MFIILEANGVIDYFSVLILSESIFKKKFKEKTKGKTSILNFISLINIHNIGGYLTAKKHGNL